MNIVLFATAWGPTYGGINSFNRDFAVALASELGNGGRVFCAVPQPSADDMMDAGPSVTLIPIGASLPADKFEKNWTFEAIHWLSCLSPKLKIDWWVGHDVTSGEAALLAAEKDGGKVALIHHMSYIGYQGYKADVSVQADSKHRYQRQLFESNSSLFAIGPLLRDSARNLSRRDVTELIPGFPEIPGSHGTTDRIVAITFGRLDEASDRIKQGRLAVAAFAAAIKRASQESFPLLTRHRPLMYVIGLTPELAEEEVDIKKLADQHAERAVNLLALPFDKERNQLFLRLRQANVAMMLSEVVPLPETAS
jgi:glycosyltransferase involved in cell wall biosynthesis